MQPLVRHDVAVDFAQPQHHGVLLRVDFVKLVRTAIATSTTPIPPRIILFSA